MADHLSSSAKELVESGSASSKRLVVEDRLSTLPLDIRSQILSCLPTIDAARVSLLSKLLRSACYSLSRFSFDYCQFPETENKLFSFVNFIDQTITHHDESDVTTLELWLWPHFCCEAPIKSWWVVFAIMHRVENLVLYGKIDMLPDQLFACQTLVKLELAIDDLVFTSENLALPNLRKLKLKYLILPEETLRNNLFSNLPALRKLSMFYCDLLDSPKDISISSKKLEEFILCSSDMYDCNLKVQAPCLSSFIYINDDAEKVHLDVNPSGLQFVINGGNPSVVNGSTNELFPSLIKVTKELFKSTYLLLSHWLIEYLSMARNLLKQVTPGQFHGILMLTIEIWPIMDHLTVSVLLVSRCPRLREFNLLIKTPRRRPRQLLCEECLIECGTGGGFRTVQSVEIVNFEGDETESMLVKFLLANMIELYGMRIVISEYLEEDDRELTMSKIFEYEKASESAYITFE